jgi:replicative DNA helicase
VSAEAEQRLIRCAFGDPTIRQRVQVTSEQFSDIRLRLVWDAMGQLDGFDELAVCDQMNTAQLEKCGGMSFVSGLSIGSGTTSNVEYYAERIRDSYLKREVQAKCSELLQADSTVTGPELLSTLVTASASLTASLSPSGRTLADTVAEERDWVVSGTGEPRGLSLGLGVDRWIPGGAPRKKVLTLFADTGTFKTTTANQMMFHMASCGYRGMLFPLEDGDDLNAHRWLSRKTGVPYGRIAGGVCDDAERQLIESVTPGEWESLKNIVSCDGIEPKIDNIIREVAAESARGGVDFVIVDYLQLLEGRGNPADVLTDAMRKAANAAKRYDLLWIFLSQQNDRNDERKDPRPTLKDMFGSAAMKQMSKTVFALFRPYEHWPDPTNSNKHPLYGMYSRMFERRPQLMQKMYPNIVELWMLKNVLGKKKSVQGLIAKPEVGILDPIELKGAA